MAGGHRRLPDPALLVITDRGQARAPLERVAAAVLGAGCRWLSLREKDLAASDRRALLERLVQLGRESSALIMVHQDAPAAAATGAAGVHLPAGGDVAEARAALGPEALIGVSCHARAEIGRAAAAGADYVTLSPIFTSASKPGYGPALGLDALAVAAAAAPVPVLALGGVSPANLCACLRAGAAGVAVMGEVMAAADPAAATARLLAAYRQCGR